MPRKEVDALYGKVKRGVKKADAAKVKKEAELSRSAEEKLLIRIRERYKVMVEADENNRRLGLEDQKFANEPGAQWDANMLKDRGTRPAMEFNKCHTNSRRIINDIRSNRPQAKVSAVEGGDKKGADLRVGLYRNIAAISDLDTVTDQAAEHQVDAGYAAIEIVREYVSDDVFDQDIKIKVVKNPFCLYADPNCKDIVLKRDADDWILTEKISKKAFEERYPDADKVEFDEYVEFDDAEDWDDGETVRVAKYSYKEPYEKEIWLVSFPDEEGGDKKITVDSTSDEGQALAKEPDIEQRILKRRTVTCQRIMMCVVSGDAILEKPTKQPGTQHPFVPVYGEIKVIDGKVVWFGAHRFAKDAQRNYNMNRTAASEAAHQVSKAPYWATETQAKGNTGHWAEAHKKNFPFMLYTPDPMAPGPPQRMAGPELPVAFLGLAEADAQDIRDITGLHETSFGEESSEKSGIAIARKQQQGQIVTFNFPDNMAKAHKRIGEIVLDYIPEVYDAERELRILGEDGKEDYVKVNELVYDPATGKTIRVNDLTSGKYDFTVTTGPSFATQRQEFTQVLMELAGRSPELMQIGGDLFFKAADMPYSEELAKRFEAMLSPQIQQMRAEGKDIPPEAQAVLAQANQAMQMAQQQTQLVQAAAQEVQTDKAASDVAKANVEKALANLKTAEAQFEAKVAKAMASLEKAKADLSITQANLQGKESDVSHRETRLKDFQSGLGDIDGIKQTLEAIDGFLAQYMEANAGALQQITAEVQKPKPKLRSIKTKREGGALIAEALMDDGSTKRVRATRGADGSLTGVPEDDEPGGTPPLAA